MSIQVGLVKLEPDPEYEGVYKGSVGSLELTICKSTWGQYLGTILFQHAVLETAHQATPEEAARALEILAKNIQIETIPLVQPVTAKSGVPRSASKVSQEARLSTVPLVAIMWTLSMV